MTRVFEIGTPEYDYIMNGIKAGQNTGVEMSLVVAIAKLTGKPVMECASALMDSKIGIQQVYRDYVGPIGGEDTL